MAHSDPTTGVAHGVTLAQASAAQRRLAEPDGLNRQHRWSIDYLDGRAVGAFTVVAAMLSAVAGVVWGAWAGVAAFGSVLGLIAAVALLRRRRQDRVRAGQPAAFERAKRTAGPAV